MNLNSFTASYFSFCKWKPNLQQMKKTLIIFLFILLVSANRSAGTNEIQNPKVKWKFRTQGPIRASGVIRGQTLCFGSSDGFIYAVSKQDGGMLWKYQTKGAITATPAVDHSSVFVSSRDNFIYSIDVRTGALKWKYAMQPILADHAVGWDYFSADPVISGKLVLVGSGDGHLYALNAQSGDLKWKFKTNGRIRATPLINDNKIYQPSNDGFVYVLNVDTGKLVWKFETKGATYNSREFGFDRNSINAQPLVEDGMLIIASRDGNTYSVDLKTRKVRWSFNYGTTWAMTTNVSENTVFVGWSTNNLFCAIDLTSGKEKWKFKSGAHNYTKPMVLDSAVYFGSADGNIYKLNKFTGEKSWAYNVGSEIFSSTIHDSGTLFFGSDDGYFYALEEGEKAFKAVYQPKTIEGIAQYLVVDQKIAPYLCQKGFEQLDSAGLYSFVKDRIEDQTPSVIVFGLPIIPENIVGRSPKDGMIRKYLESGGKIVWLGDIPNNYSPDGAGNFKRDPSIGIELLEVNFETPLESGNYFSKTTQEGLNRGLPSWIKTTNVTVAPEGVIPFSYDEYGRVSLWMKKFNSRPGSGFISCRTWSWNVPVKDSDIELIHQMAVYGLE